MADRILLNVIGKIINYLCIFVTKSWLRSLTQRLINFHEQTVKSEFSVFRIKKRFCFPHPSTHSHQKLIVIIVTISIQFQGLLVYSMLSVVTLQSVPKDSVPPETQGRH